MWRVRVGLALLTVALASVAWAPTAASAAGSAGMAYVANANSNNVTPIDVQTTTPGTNIPLPGGASVPAGIAITPDGKTAYVIDQNSDDVTPIDLRTNSAGARISIPGAPFGIAITPDGKTAYVAEFTTNQVTPIDLITNTAEASITISDANGPTAIAITPDGKTAYVTDFDSHVTPIDLLTNTAKASIALPSASSFPEGIAIAPDGKTAYVTDANTNTVTPIDLKTNTAGTDIALSGAASGPFAIAITPDGKRAYVTNQGSNDVTPIDLQTHTAGADISYPSGGVFLFGIAITPDGATAYVANLNSANVTPIDLQTNTADANVALPGASGPNAIAFTPDQGPSAAFTSTPRPAGETTSFDGSGSSDPDGTVARYDWNFGDGTTLVNGGATPSHTYASGGTYNVTLTVTDNQGCSTALVFTGQTASCNSAPGATMSRQVTIPGAPVISIASPASGGTYAVEQVVKTSFSCSPGIGSSGVSSCTDSGGASGGKGRLNTSTVGSHTYTVTATSSEGLTATRSISYTVAGAPSVAITSPAGSARFIVAQKVRASYRCADGRGGPGLRSCSGPVASGAPIDTAYQGRHTFTVTAISRDGQSVRRKVTYSVVLPNNRLVPLPRLKAYQDGRFFVTVKVPGPGRVDIMVTAWNSNFARAAALLQPAPGRFVFARAKAIASRATTLRISVPPNARGRQLVGHHRYRVTLRLWVTYTPTHGRPRSVGFYGLHLPDSD